MDQATTMGMMFCMIVGLLFWIVIIALVVTQTIFQARILHEVKRIGAHSGPTGT